MRQNAASPARPRSRQRATWWLMRLVWASLGLIHLPILVSVGLRSPETGGMPLAVSIASLGLSVGFFLLKAIDLPLLRVSLRRSTLVALALVVAVLHQDLLDLDDHAPVLASSAAVLVAGVTGERAWRGRRRLLASLLGLREGLAAGLAMVVPVAWSEPPARELVPVRGGSCRFGVRGPPRRG